MLIGLVMIDFTFMESYDHLPRPCLATSAFLARDVIPKEEPSRSWQIWRHHSLTDQELTF